MQYAPHPAACMPHPAQMSVVAGPGTMDWTVSRRGICHARLRQLELADVHGAMQGSPPARPPTNIDRDRKCSKRITKSPTIQIRSFISSLYVIARWDPKCFFIPRHSAVGILSCDDCTLPWLSPDGLNSYLFSPMCIYDWPVIAWHLNLSITGALGVAWSGLNWRYLHSLHKPYCKSKPQTGNVVKCNSWFQFRHCMSPIKLCWLRKQSYFAHRGLRYYTLFTNIFLLRKKLCRN